MFNAPIIVGLGFALLWVTYEIEFNEKQTKGADLFGVSKPINDTITPRMKDATMPDELNRFMSRTQFQDRDVQPIPTPQITNALISEPLTLNQLQRGISLTTGIADWLAGPDKAVVVTDLGSSTNMQGTDDPLVSWIGRHSNLSLNPTQTVYTFAFSMRQPQTIVISLTFRATGATTIDLIPRGMQPMSIYKRDTNNGDVMGGTGRSQPETCSANASIGSGDHMLVVTVRSSIGRPAIFWGSGSIGGGVVGNFY